MNLSRRGVLGAGLGLAAIAGGSRLVYGERDAATAASLFGEHQPGIATAAQEHLSLVALNVLPGIDAAAVNRLLRLWTGDAELLMSGAPSRGDNEGTLAGGDPALTITFGFGHSLFAKVGLDQRWPFALRQIPTFKIDQLQPQWSDGDLVIQVSGNDRVRVHHALRELVLGAKPFAAVVWQQNGFLPRADLDSGLTGRNLMGQKDGTANYAADSAEFAKTVWSSAPSEFSGGTAMVVRRISMNLDKWELLSPGLKSKSIGRDIVTGAPLSGGDEFTDADFEKRDHHGLVIPADAHMRRARETNERMHRRGYSYQTDGPTVDSGLIFIAFVADPNQFVKVQTALDQMDSLNTWTTPIGSALFAVPPGSPRDQWIGQSLFV